MGGSAEVLSRLVQATAGLHRSHFQESCCGMKESNRRYYTIIQRENKVKGGLDSILHDISGSIFFRCTCSAII